LVGEESHAEARRRCPEGLHKRKYQGQGTGRQTATWGENESELEGVGTIVS